jgi:hypothetical protein
MTTLILWATAYFLFVVLLARLLKRTHETQSFSDIGEYYRRAVEAAGGEYVGIQECEGRESLILFNSPKTGSTLAVKESNFTSVAVQNRIEQHEAEWGKD